jgi:hypothetical protein
MICKEQRAVQESAADRRNVSRRQFSLYQVTRQVGDDDVEYLAQMTLDADQVLFLPQRDRGQVI